MGDRATIELKFASATTPSPSIFVYTHWGATTLPVTLAEALERGESRWNDDVYLARILASAVFNQAGITDTTGAGLHVEPIDTTYWIVDTAVQTVIAPRGWSEYDIEPGKVFTFPEFVAYIKAKAATGKVPA